MLLGFQWILFSNWTSNARCNWLPKNRLTYKTSHARQLSCDCKFLEKLQNEVDKFTILPQVTSTDWSENIHTIIENVLSDRDCAAQ